ncbi:hypothetical protein PF001_g27101 [Phytophthora fragariae]|uniref:Uncharacterized protein n=1 Tax=Phytophthora fragariae TaxID=53985 RepID=A0A6A4BIG7_9STRA|nr:hypothetical protein PF004_g26699 [Phytophthora fragariae]KAE9274343.1 hypothetical protein PF001_g27101 [Phytophthora fragariae]
MFATLSRFFLRSICHTFLPNGISSTVFFRSVQVMLMFSQIRGTGWNGHGLV